MQPSVLHRYVAELSVDGGAKLTTAPLQADWTPVVEWSHFQDVRRGHAAPSSVPGRVRIEPQWDERSGPPYVSGIRSSPSDDAGAPEEIPLAFLAGAVRQAVATLVETGRVREAAQYTWRICAYEAATGVEASRSGEAFTVEQAAEIQQVLKTSRLEDLRSRAVHHGPASDEARSDFPVFVLRSVVDEAADIARAAGELESGGVLLGTLSRAEDTQDLMLQITAQVPAREALAEAASLRFTPQTWQAVAAAIRLRSANERIVGWWHSHPRKVWACHGCPPKRRARCPSNRPFFSGMDVTVHRTAFQGALNVALLLSFHEDPAPLVDLFGWRQGMVGARDYYVLEEMR